MDYPGNVGNVSIEHDLLMVAANDRLFDILDTKSQKKLLRFVYKYTKECLKNIEKQYNLVDSDEENYEDFARHHIG